MKPRILFHVFAVLVCVAAVAAAQSTPQKTKPAPTNGTHDRESSAPSVSEVTLGKSTDRKSGSVIVLDRDAPSGQTTGRREASTGMATGKRQHEPVLDRDAATGVVGARETSSGMASGKRQHADVTIEGSANADQPTSLNAKSSAHATESLNTEQKPQAQSNPLYKDNTNQGSNPLFEGKAKTAAKPGDNGSKSKTVEYKDGEDQTRRTRPGNNKPSK